MTRSLKYQKKNVFKKQFLQVQKYKLQTFQSFYKPSFKSTRFLINEIQTHNFEMLIAKTSSNLTHKDSTLIENIYHEDEYPYLIRQNLKLPHSQIQKIHIQKYTAFIKKNSFMLIYLSDDRFFEQFTQRYKRRKKLKQIANQIKSFSSIVRTKMNILLELVEDFFRYVQSYIRFINFPIDQKIRQKIQIIKDEEEQKIIRFLLPNVYKFIEIYKRKNSQNDKLQYTQDSSTQQRLEIDKQIKTYLKLQIQKMFPINNSSFKKPTLTTQNKPVNFTFNFQYKQFFEKIIYKFKEIYQCLHNLIFNNVNKQEKSSSDYSTQATISDITMDNTLGITYSMGSTMMKFLDTQSTMDISDSAFFSDEIQAVSDKYYFKRKIVQNFQIEDFVSTKCLNCLQFFYKNLPFEPERNSVVDYQIINSVRSIKKEPFKILQNMTAFLNKGSGTLIFDCKPTTYGFEPLGHKMYLKEQQGYKHSFQNLLKYIQPQNNRKFIEYEIDFLPLKQNPHHREGQKKISSQQPLIERKISQDQYVMRVKIRSKSNTDFYGCQLDKVNYFYIRQNNRTKAIQSQKVYQEMKKKLFHYYRIKSNLQMKNLQLKFDKYFLEYIIKGRRYNPSNQHQGQCKPTLILSSVK